MSIRDVHLLLLLAHLFKYVCTHVAYFFKLPENCTDRASDRGWCRNITALIGQTGSGSAEAACQTAVISSQY